MQERWREHPLPYGVWQGTVRDRRGEGLGLILNVETQSGHVYAYEAGSVAPATEARMARENDGATVKSGEILTASNHRFLAFVDLDADSSYELYGCGVVVLSTDGVPEAAWQDEAPFEEWERREKAADPSFEAFPYSYAYYDDSDAERDHHVGDDGWSPTYPPVRRTPGE